MSTEFTHNPEHAFGTCAKCGEEMVANVPRLGVDGGFIHKSTGEFMCGVAKLEQENGQARSHEEIAKECGNNAATRHFALGPVITVEQSCINAACEAIRRITRASEAVSVSEVTESDTASGNPESGSLAASRPKEETKQ